MSPKSRLQAPQPRALESGIHGADIGTGGNEKSGKLTNCGAFSQMTPLRSLIRILAHKVPTGLILHRKTRPCHSAFTTQILQRSLEKRDQKKAEFRRQRLPKIELVASKNTSRAPKIEASFRECFDTLLYNSHFFKNCFVYSQMQIEAETCTLRERIMPSCGISTQSSRSCNKSTGMPLFSFPSSKTVFSGNVNC